MSQSVLLTDELLARAANAAPGGVHSNVRLTSPRIFFERGEGARLWDVEGREYVDYLLGQGPAFLGHGHPVVTRAVANAVADGMVYGAQHPREVDAGEALLQCVGWAERVRFGVSGTESVQAALRLARAATGRRKVMRFAGHYHGWLDNVLMSFAGEPGIATQGQDPNDLRDWVICDFNDSEGARRLAIEHRLDLAAIIVEPVMCNAGAIPADRSFLETLRALATETGAVFIMDEVITGFRLALGGASEHFGIVPDLAVYGKAVAGGWPVSALAGSAELMDLFGTGAVNHSGTFNASVMASAAVSATLGVLRADPPYERVARHGTALMEGIRNLAAQNDLPISVQGHPAAFSVSFGPDVPFRNLRDLEQRDTEKYARFANDLASEGVWVAPRGIWYVSAVHDDEILKTTLDRVDAAMKRFRR